MKVILLRDVAKLGRRHTVVEVPDGFALNSLIPKKWATPATPENMKKVAARDAHLAEEKTSQAAAFLEWSKVVPTLAITVAADATPQGSLFKAVKAETVAAAINALGVAVPEVAVRLAEPVKHTGQHEAQLVHEKQVTPFSFTVISK